MTAGSTLLVLLLGSALDAPPPASPAKECRERVAAARYEAAVPVCREALAAASADRGLVSAAARAEVEAGDAARAVGLLEGLLAGERDAETARELAMALWRAGRLPDAEEALRRLRQESDSLRSRNDLCRFLLTHDRYEEASRAAREATNDFPAACEPEEWLGAAEAALGRHREAATAFASAVRKGCPPFRWTGLTAVPREIGRPEYLALLDARRLLAGASALPEDEVLERLRLLSLVFVPARADDVARLALARPEHSIRLAAIGVLSGAGAGTPDAWKALLLSETFVVRRLALRRIRELALPGFRPLLEEHLVRESVPGNRALTAVALAALLGEDETERRAALLESVPAADDLRPLALRQLADLAAARGDEAAAASLRREAESWTPQPPPVSSPSSSPAAPPALTVRTPAPTPGAP